MVAGKRRCRSAVEGLVVLVVAFTAVAAGAAEVPAADTLSASPRFRITPEIVNGVMTAQYPTTGVLLDSGNFNSASMICSGTLIGCQTFLTAGHCVAGNLNPSSYSVFLQHAGFFSVASVTLNPDFNFPVGDVAVIKLSNPVNGIAPTPIDTAGAPVFGTSGVIVGFGRSGGGASNVDYGLKRSGDVTLTSCSGGVSNSTSVCWDFTNPLGPPGSNSDTCNGDSGGPLFVDGGAGMVLAGSTSGGTSSTCLPADHSYDANVFFYHTWIQAQGGTDLNNTSCGMLPQVGQPGTSVLAASGQLGDATPQATQTFQVSAGTSQLRVAMNAIDDGNSDFDLYVKYGNPATTSDFDCKANGPGQYGFCQFDAPTPGTYYALVNRFAGSGAYQLTGTTFGSDCSAPSSNGQPCDDGNACTDNDTCQSGNCVGTAVADGTPCDDGNVCTQPDTCQAGVCMGGNAPLSGCVEPFVPGRGLLEVQDRHLDQHDTLMWNWTHGAATNLGAFGNPLFNTNYTLCMFDQNGGTNRVVMAEQIPAGATCGSRPCWRPLASGFKYSSRGAIASGVRTLSLKQGTDGKARILVKGENMSLTPALPLQQQNMVTVQLSNGTACWEARYSTNLVNTAGKFKAKSD